jgi:hypothetical protein
MGISGLDKSGLGYEQMTGSCAHGNKTPDSKEGNFLTS